MYFTSNTHTMNDIRNTLTENAEQATVLGKCHAFNTLTENAKQATVLGKCHVFSVSRLTPTQEVT